MIITGQLFTISNHQVYSRLWAAQAPVVSQEFTPTVEWNRTCLKIGTSSFPLELFFVPMKPWIYRFLILRYPQTRSHEGMMSYKRIRFIEILWKLSFPREKTMVANCASGQIAVIPKPELRWCWGDNVPYFPPPLWGNFTNFWGTARDEFCHLGPSKKRFQPIFLPKKVAMPSKKLEVRAEALSLAQWFMVL